MTWLLSLPHDPQFRILTKDSSLGIRNITLINYDKSWNNFIPEKHDHLAYTIKKQIMDMPRFYKDVRVIHKKTSNKSNPIF